jgi:uncharacterized protein (DUF1786 family)
MDTAPAAVAGALLDRAVREDSRLLAVNIGNFHTLAFKLDNGKIRGVFEHHTGLLDQVKLESLLKKLAAGTLTNTEVFDDQGHGALVYSEEPLSAATFLNDNLELVITGPRRSMMNSSNLDIIQAAPFGDMMITGCFGLLSAFADLVPEHSEPVKRLLGDNPDQAEPPWEIESG